MLLRQLDEPDRVPMTQRERLLAVHVLPRRERRRGDLEVGLRHGQVDDRVDGVVGEHRVEVRVRTAAELRDERLGPCGVEVGRAGELELRCRADRGGVAVGDLAGADEHDPHCSHPSSCSRIARISSLGS